MQYKSMKITVFMLLILIWGINVQAQIYFKSEYMTSSMFKNENGESLGGNGDFKTINGSIRVPLSVKTDENNKPAVWAITLAGTYAVSDNKDLLKDYHMPEILNAQISLMHMKPLNEKWSIFVTLGGRIYTAGLKNISGNAILGQGGILFMNHAKQDFNWGAGIIINNILGYPMVFPAFYLNWQLNKKYNLKLSQYESFEISINSQINDQFKLSIVGESKRLTPVIKKERTNMFFVAQYEYAGIQPEYKMTKNFSVFAIGGISFRRNTYFCSRTLKDFYYNQGSHPHFGTSVYLAAGIKYNF